MDSEKPSFNLLESVTESVKWGAHLFTSTSHLKCVCPVVCRRFEDAPKDSAMLWHKLVCSHVLCCCPTVSVIVHLKAFRWFPTVLYFQPGRVSITCLTRQSSGIPNRPSSLQSFPALTSCGFPLCQHPASFSTLPLLCSAAFCISPSLRLARGLAFHVCCRGSGERILLASSLCCFFFLTLTIRTRFSVLLRSFVYCLQQISPSFSVAAVLILLTRFFKRLEFGNTVALCLFRDSSITVRAFSFPVFCIGFFYEQSNLHLSLILNLSLRLLGM